MKILHTSDWHLGHYLHGIDRHEEHTRFLDWLLEQLDYHDADALIVSGDIFDHANPSSASQRLLYGFLAELVRRRPKHFRTVLVGGNHDSAIRLDAPAPLLEAMRVHVVGGLPREGRALDPSRIAFPLYRANGEIGAHIMAMPFLRPSDLPAVPEAEDVDPLIEGVRQRYAEALAYLRGQAAPDQALLATGHCYMVKGEISGLSERRILGGNQHALPSDIFPEWLAYVALGHLHKAQRVAGRENLRYSGSPIPLSFSERDYRHQVVLVALDGNSFVEAQTLAVPRFVDMIRIGPEPLAQVEARLAALPEDQAEGGDRDRPYLEVIISLEQPEKGLRRRLEEALKGKRARLLKISLQYTGTGAALGDGVVAERLVDLGPEQVFEKCYRRDHEADMPAELANAFQELMLAATEATP